MSESRKYDLEMVVPSLPDKIAEVEQASEKLLIGNNISEDDRDCIAIALTEVVANAIFHGNKRDANKKVWVRIKITSESVKFTVRDQGTGFNPDSLANPLDPQNLLKDSGRGIFIIRTLMDKVKYKFSKTGTQVTMIKYRKTIQ